jgi:hypothetical protein
MTVPGRKSAQRRTAGTAAKEVRGMGSMTHSCPECGGERLFEQVHIEAGDCPDSPDGHCPEWSCTECGAALLAGFLSYGAVVEPVLHVHGKVA